MLRDKRMIGRDRVFCEGGTCPEMDIPCSFGKLLMSESAGNVQANNRQGRDTFTIASGVLQANLAQNFGELGTLESRANSGVMATPIAGPTTAQPS